MWKVEYVFGGIMLMQVGFELQGLRVLRVDRVRAKLFYVECTGALLLQDTVPLPMLCLLSDGSRVFSGHCECA